jgi:phosphoglycolate phosphatase-like HAD superfamily hydrolase
MLGPAPVVDFDGTMARLDVAWSALRATAGVQRIDELWARADNGVWSDVTRAETLAAQTAAPVEVLVPMLERTRAIAVLTSNAEASVRAFLDRFPELDHRVVHVVGRETLAGPKTDFEVFERGYHQCVDATAAWRGAAPVVYVGDLAYELEFARRLGATAIDVASLDPREPSDG